MWIAKRLGLDRTFHPRGPVRKSFLARNFCSRRSEGECGNEGLFKLGNLGRSDTRFVIALVFVDNTFGALLSDQRTRYRDQVIGTELKNPSFAQLAEVFGAKGIKTDPDRLDQALEEA